MCLAKLPGRSQTLLECKVVKVRVVERKVRSSRAGKWFVVHAFIVVMLIPS